MKTGEIWLVGLDPTIGDEIRKTRLVVVLNAGERKSLRLAIVLDKKGAVDCFQMRALSHRRFFKRLGVLSGEEMDRVRTAVALILDIEPEHCT